MAAGEPKFLRLALYATTVDPRASYMVSPVVRAFFAVLAFVARLRGWDKLFAPWAKAWEVIGPLKPQFRKDHFRGHGRVLAGIHDSSGNYLRYLAGGRKHFTLLSTGTWIIGFDTDTGITDAALAHLQAFPNLAELYLGTTNISDAGLEHLMALPQLQFVDLNQTLVTPAGVRKLCQALPHLQVH